MPLLHRHHHHHYHHPSRHHHHHHPSRHSHHQRLPRPHTAHWWAVTCLESPWPSIAPLLPPSATLQRYPRPPRSPRPSPTPHLHVTDLETLRLEGHDHKGVRGVDLGVSHDEEPGCCGRDGGGEVCLLTLQSAHEASPIASPEIRPPLSIKRLVCLVSREGEEIQLIVLGPHSLIEIQKRVRDQVFEVFNGDRSPHLRPACHLTTVPCTTLHLDFYVPYCT
ncbi:hypothetical protein E2C01_003629 [Portunus trituberculatus]|uniref:Uncharacterized protein n=1 Tax=Portunus trituberculatus TaxID=210409 RepID=A0A5B7CQA1_PORTR|nr:hypothetical protein [Portunus trituberculatus]